MHDCFIGRGTGRCMLQVTLLQDKINGMRLEFSDMLQLTLDKMHQKLEVAFAPQSHSS
jgi:hypothetical protein